MARRQAITGAYHLQEIVTPEDGDVDSSTMAQQQCNVVGEPTDGLGIRPPRSRSLSESSAVVGLTIPREKIAVLNMNAGSPVASPPSQPRRLMASRFLSEPGDAPIEPADIDGPQKLSLYQHTAILSRTNLKVETNFRSDCL